MTVNKEDGGKIGGSGVHFPLAPVKRLADLRNRANGQRYSSIHEDQRRKTVEDIVISDGETIKPRALKRPELDPNRGYPNNQTVRQISLCYSRELARWEG